jgi:hypothetical protein
VGIFVRRKSLSSAQEKLEEFRKELEKSNISKQTKEKLLELLDRVVVLVNEEKTQEKETL